MNVSGIDPPITPKPGYTIAETLGLHDFCTTPCEFRLILDQTGLWNFCEGYYRLNQNSKAVITGCGPSGDSYFFDPIGIMATELLPPYSIVFVQPEVDAIQVIQNTASWLRAAFVITALFTGFTLLIGPLTGVWHQRRLFNCIPVGTMCFAALFWFMGAVTATNVYFKLRNSFNNDTRLNVEAHMGHQMFAWVWLGVWTSSTAAGQWCCAAICCPGGHRKRRIEMRKRLSSYNFINRSSFRGLAFNTMVRISCRPSIVTSSNTPESRYIISDPLVRLHQPLTSRWDSCCTGIVPSKPSSSTS